ncbi:enhancer of polycomb homolog 1 [Galendromus occidentalis]|uniref:Enhancer of polycomb-like protein n=1 Tax=Galendromus occidentalis TaxID=34638 RepID=A0AAJ6QUB7_9ACAR|nr:enhancer of polycomb homolog 1 [Galendromus occidentalis]
MSKLSFRARALDATKAMPVYRSEDIPDLPDFAAINRAVPQMPTGMEKEEECETHLQRAMTAQQTYGHTGELVIPTPVVYPLDSACYDRLYPSTFKLPKQLIYMQPLLSGLDDDTPEYDLDSEDEIWLSRQKLGLSQLQFETMIDRLEKASNHQIIQINEAKLLLKQDDDILIAVYDYWLNKRLKLKSSTLMPQIKTEKRDGSNSANPYVAFRRRTEKMQTRKNRKNDEASYEKMLKLKRDLKKAFTLLEMVKKREKLKREDLHLTVEVFEKRVQAGDLTGAIVAETLHQLTRQKQQQQQLARESLYGTKSHEGLSSRNNGYVSNSNSQQIRELKAKHRKSTQGSRLSSHKRPRDHRELSSNGSVLNQRELVAPVSLVGAAGDATPRPDVLMSSEEDEDEVMSSGTEDMPDGDMSQEPDGIFTFRRKRNVTYLPPLPLDMGVAGDNDDDSNRDQFHDEGAPHQKFHLTTVQLDSDESDLSGLEDVEMSTISNLQFGNEEHFATLHTARVKALQSAAAATSGAADRRKRRHENYITFFGRRRYGRGGRILFDRMNPNDNV